MFATTEQRSPTNRGAITFTVVLSAICVLFVAICFFDGSIYRLTSGYDDCGNICGHKNSHANVNVPGCKTQDMTNRPFTLLGNSFRAGNETYTHAECVESCDKTKYNIIGNRCFEKSKDSDGKIDDDVVDFGVILSKSIGPIIISVIVAGVFSFIVLALFRHVIKHIIWGIYIGMVVFFILMSVGFIIASISASSSSDPQARESATVFLFPAAIFGILGIILAVVLYIFRVRIKLVIAIFKEASKVLQDVMPLLFQPVLTMISFLVALAIFGYFFVTISVSGPYQEIKNPESGRYELVENNPGAKGIASYTITGFVYFFFVNFILGCQHFIIASTVSQWYFTRDKTKLDAPISTAYSHLLSFHLGAICLGALLITIVKIVLGILRSMVRNNSESPLARFVAMCIESLLKMLEELLEFLLRNAYIIVALKGTPMFESGKKAIGLLKENLIDVYALNKIGDFVMVLARLFVAAFAGILCYNLIPDVNGQSIGIYGAIIAAILGFLIIHCFMTVFEMAVDTIFMCFCVDCEENDGVHQQYYMSPKLMNAMQEIKGYTGGKQNFEIPNNYDPSQPLYPNPPPNYNPSQPLYPNPNSPSGPQKIGFNV